MVMQPEIQSEGSAAQGARKRDVGRTLLKSGLAAIVLFAVFTIGVNVGNGRIQMTATQGKNASLPENLDYSSVEDIYDSLKENYDGKLTQAQLVDGLKHGLADATNDPYTEYFTAKQAKQFSDSINNSFTGIGAELSQDKDKNIIVISPISGFPAEKAGLKAQDIIVTIDGKSTQGMTVSQAVDKIRGKKGTVVKLGIVRDKTEPLNLSITRDVIQAPSVNTKILDDNIGYMRINSFAEDTSELAKKAAEDFKQKNVKGVILDLRNNPGGYLDAAVDVSSLWVPEGKLVVDEKGTQGGKQYVATGGTTLEGVPTVVLINDGSASASEITAGALHDNKVATIIGEKSYGKGVVQQLIKFRDGSQLKVTIASWYRPNGQNINHKGITPDQKVELAKDATPDNDNQLQAAQDYLNK